MMPEQVDEHKQKKMYLDTNFTSLIKANFKCIIDLNVNYKMMKLRKKKNQDDLWYGDDFVDTTTKAWCMKKIINKFDFINIQKFLWKNTFKWMGSRAMDMEKIFANDISDNGLSS